MISVKIPLIPKTASFFLISSSIFTFSALAFSNCFCLLFKTACCSSRLASNCLILFRFSASSSFALFKAAWASSNAFSDFSLSFSILFNDSVNVFSLFLSSFNLAKSEASSLCFDLRFLSILDEFSSFVPTPKS